MSGSSYRLDQRERDFSSNSYLSDTASQGAIPQLAGN